MKSYDDLIVKTLCSQYGSCTCKILSLNHMCADMRRIGMGVHLFLQGVRMTSGGNDTLVFNSRYFVHFMDCLQLIARAFSAMERLSGKGWR